MNSSYQPKITVFYCINAFNEKSALPVIEEGAVHLKYVKMACSSMVKDVFILKAFESGTDGVVVFVCPEEACRYVEGSIRASKRVFRVKQILNEIGLDPDRLSIFNTLPGDAGRIEKIVKETTARIAEMGPIFTAD
jgi:F420-non-reducing hydrogenase iron-sulfur subunit